MTAASGARSRLVEQPDQDKGYPSVATPSPPRNTPEPRHWELPRDDRFLAAGNAVQLRLIQPGQKHDSSPVVYQTLLPVLRLPPTQLSSPGGNHGNRASSTAAVRSFRGSDTSGNTATVGLQRNRRSRYAKMHLGCDPESSDLVTGAVTSLNSWELVSDKLWPQDRSFSSLPRALPPIRADQIRRPRREIVVPENLGEIIRRKLMDKTIWPPSVDSRGAIEDASD
ncbi:hypothetical protein BOX15_Mlig021909g2 [Macrostomum lignano]|uniref:Uncharacterized protein n=1 Tax=Macrostomum lignano TaxID=282301 RepID=A0A267DNU4_9PLAT|nr:hypothetical protein BOX15_Mlig021909g2 [Macrostomum lignano]